MGKDRTSQGKLKSTQRDTLLQMLDTEYHDSFMLGARLTTIQSLLDRGYIRGYVSRSQITAEGLDALEKEYSGREYSIEALREAQRKTLAKIAAARKLLATTP
jgi:hypothetical protein